MVGSGHLSPAGQSLQLEAPWYGWNEVVGSIENDKIFSGVSAATASISIPPSVEHTNETLLDCLSTKMAKYSSVVISDPSSM